MCSSKKSLQRLVSADCVSVVTTLLERYCNHELLPCLGYEHLTDLHVVHLYTKFIILNSEQ